MSVTETLPAKMTEGRKGVGITIDNDKHYFIYDNWFRDRLDDRSGGSMTEHAKEIIEHYLPGLSYSSFVCYPIKWGNGKHIKTGENFCGWVK